MANSDSKNTDDIESSSDVGESDGGCQYTYTRETEKNSKGDICGNPCKDGSNFCNTHANTSQAKFYGKPKCQALKRDGETKCGRNVCKESKDLCTIHFKQSQRSGDTQQCKAMTSVKGSDDKRQCSKNAIKDSDFCRTHTKCQFDLGNGKLCAKKTHKLSVKFCIDHDGDTKCVEEKCREPRCDKSKKGHCSRHYHLLEAKDICRWPAGCDKKPKAGSQNHYCSLHEKRQHRPQCKFITVNRKNKEMIRCVDHINDNEDFCDKHSKKYMKFTTNAEKLGRAVAICMRDGSAKIPTSLAIHNALGLQFALRSRLEQFENAVQQGKCANIDENDDVENVEPKKRGRPKKTVDQKAPARKPKSHKKESDNESESESDDGENADEDTHKSSEKKPPRSASVATKSAKAELDEKKSETETSDEESDSEVTTAYEVAKRILDDEETTVIMSTKKGENLAHKYRFAKGAKKNTIAITIDGTKKKIMSLEEFKNFPPENETIDGWEREESDAEED